MNRLLLILFALLAGPLFAQSTWIDSSTLTWADPSWTPAGSQVWQPVSLLAWPEVSTHGILLTWTASPTPGVTYNIYRSAVSGQEAAPALATGVTTPSYNDQPLADGLSYCYEVTAVLPGAESAFSNESCATVPVGTP